MSKNVLENLGLTPNESNIYQYLLSTQASLSAHEITLALSLDKVSTYRALKSLEQQNLITVTGEKRTQRYQLNSTKELFNKYENQVQELSSLRSQLDELITHATSEQHDFYLKNKIQIYKGKEGYRLWNYERLKNGTKTIKEFGSDNFIRKIFDTEDELFVYMNKYIQDRVSNKISMQSLVTPTANDWIFNRSDKKLLKEFKILETNDEVEAYMSIFGNRFGFYTKQGNEYLGVIIDDLFLASMMTTLFNALWVQGKSKK